ncbi:glycogen synthase GlgA [Pseudolactococcus insecticola]|uniref:Glycogen synthase n=1 Tax=Pseudolactococcus insecticola TaxID=2709158 RepID=A0A6A0B3H8_9LACT|nr:glycogen synthase GlgA [Lactococcus insecticola]GFH39636.1 glycogen synthase [Lactococcus insecticola]
MKILLAAAEGAPFIKTGGLGDVVGALPKSLNHAADADVRVILPYYKKIAEKFSDKIEDVFWTFVDVGWRHQYVGVKKITQDKTTVYFIDNDYYFGSRDEVYGYDDDGERFAYFQLAILEVLERLDFVPDVLHANDYHTALLPFLLKEKYSWIQAFDNVHTVLTIHNIEFQGQYDPVILSDLLGMGDERYRDGTVRMADCFNWLKTGILYADRVTTVSPSYAGEIQTPAFGKGLDGILRMVSGKLSGFINGIDTALYDPKTDAALQTHFDVQNLAGKAENKKQLQERLGLPVRADVPVIGIVSRLTYQKGFNLVVDEMCYLLEQDVQVVLLGTGDPRFEHDFAYFANTYPDKISANITFNLGLAQLIYAGSDFFLMPSAFEPCGLSQMMSMRYGTLPIVHEVGGLRDTVQAYNQYDGTGTGFSFADFTGYQMMQTLRRAIDIYRDKPEVFKQLQKQAMTADFSWDTASQPYLSLYRDMLD